jgi:hypothetical protein
MSRYRLIIAEVATGVVRRADCPFERFDRSAGHIESLVYDREDDAMWYLDDVLKRWSDVEVIMRPEDWKIGGNVYRWKDGCIFKQSIDSDEQMPLTLNFNVIQTE